eukprot:2302348-Prorocentrum_lima.AAC.1
MAAMRVKTCVVPGSTVQDSREALRLATEEPMVLSAAGVHPYHASHPLGESAGDSAGIAKQKRRRDAPYLWDFPPFFTVFPSF